MLNELLDSRMACQLLHISGTSLRRWVKRLHLTPRWRGRGRGCDQLFAAQQIWALAVAKAVASEHRMALAVKVGATLESFDVDEICDSFAAGKNCLMIGLLSDDFVVRRELMAPEAINDVRSEMAQQLDVKWIGFEVQTSLVDLMNQLQQHAEQSLN